MDGSTETLLANMINHGWVIKNLTGKSHIFVNRNLNGKHDKPWKGQQKAIFWSPDPLLANIINHLLVHKKNLTGKHDLSSISEQNHTG